MSKLKLNPTYSAERSAVFVASRPVDALRFEKMSAQSDDEDDSYRYISDVALLLNTERLVKVLGSDNYNQLLSSKKTVSPYLLDAKRYTDEQLFSAIKPRSVQANTEVRAWMNILTDEVMNLESTARDDIRAKFESEVQKALQKQQQQPKTE